MILGKVIGTIWATRKDEAMVGMKLQIVKHVDLDYKLKDSFVVAVDTVQAGVGDIVLVVSGSSARQTADLQRPVSGSDRPDVGPGWGASRGHRLRQLL